MPRKKNESPVNIYKPFPSHLRELMAEHGDNQEALAKVLGSTRQTISLYANGNSAPTYDIVLKIAEHYGVSVDWLIGREGAVKSPEISMQSACEITGLSEEAINNVIRIRDDCDKLEPLKPFEFLLHIPQARMREAMECLSFAQLFAGMPKGEKGISLSEEEQEKALKCGMVFLSKSEASIFFVNRAIDELRIGLVKSLAQFEIEEKEEQ